MATQKERFVKYLQTCVKSTRASENNPLTLGGNAPKDYSRFLEPDRLFDYNPSKWAHVGSMYDINDYSKALEIFYELIADEDFLKRDKTDNQGWRRGSISHYVCFLCAQEFFSNSEDSKSITLPANNSLPLQQIYYGAPGTGKSHSINELTKNATDVFRTTFHPDSDYSTFVGAYKPTKNVGQKIVGKKELVAKCREYAQRSGYNNQNLTQFGYDFSQSIQKLYQEVESFTYSNLLTEAGITDTSASSYISAGIDLYSKTASKIADITYSFVPQTFTNAYLKAWKNKLSGENEPVYLVIEEINRGNCAQIFGDLFQLLDRDDNTGMSCYPIIPDTDLGNFIAEKLSDYASETNEWDKVVNGEILLIPDNLYIWATMNTSDQSLFPIDSAFKRRWDWRYVPIHKVKDADYKIEVSENGNIYRYDWWDFLDKVNTAIGNATSSEDKKLGYFFCKADKKANDTDKVPSIITANRFVGKVIFYIWNDVFKDYDTKDAEFTYKSKGGEEMQLSLLSYKDGETDVKREFSSFFDCMGNALPSEVIRLLDDLKVGYAESIEEHEYDENPNKKYVKFRDGTEFKEGTYFDIYLKALQKIGIDRVAEIANEIQDGKSRFRRCGRPWISKEQYEEVLNNKNYSYIEADGYYIIKNGVGPWDQQQFLNYVAERLKMVIEVGWSSK